MAKWNQFSHWPSDPVQPVYQCVIDNGPTLATRLQRPSRTRWDVFQSSCMNILSCTVFADMVPVLTQKAWSRQIPCGYNLCFLIWMSQPLSQCKWLHSASANGPWSPSHSASASDSIQPVRMVPDPPATQPVRVTPVSQCDWFLVPWTVSATQVIYSQLAASLKVL